MIGSSIENQKSLLELIKCKKCASKNEQSDDVTIDTKPNPIAHDQPKNEPIIQQQKPPVLDNVNKPLVNQPSSSSREAILKKISTTTRVIPNHTSIKNNLETGKKLEEDSQTNHAPSSTFNRLRGIMDDCAKKLSERAKKPTVPANFKPNRILPLQDESQAQMANYSKLLELHVNDPSVVNNEDFLAVTQWTVIESKRRRNDRLEKIFHARNEAKIDLLKERYQRTKNSIFEKFTHRNDLIQNLQHLMNYDFCSKKYRNKTTSNRSSRKKAKKPKEASSSGVVETSTDIMFDLYDLDLKKPPEDSKPPLDELDDDLYGDLNDANVMPCLQADEPREDGELEDESQANEMAPPAKVETNKPTIREKNHNITTQRDDQRNSNKYRSKERSVGGCSSSKENNQNHGRHSSSVKKTYNERRDRTQSSCSWRKRERSKSRTRSRSRNRHKYSRSRSRSRVRNRSTRTRSRSRSKKIDR